MRSILSVMANFSFYALFLVIVVNYIISSRALYILALRRGIKSPGYAWIPVGNAWIVGKLSDDYDSKNGKDKKIGKALFALSAISSVALLLSLILILSVVGTARHVLFIREVGIVFSGLILVLLLGVSILILAKTAFKIICIYKIFESTVPENTVKYLLVYCLVPFVGAMCLDECKDKGYDNKTNVSSEQ